MRGVVIVLILVVIFILAIVYGAPLSSNGSEPEQVPDNPTLPLKPKHDTAIVVTPDGMLYFVEIGSGEVLWSFSSGPSIYSSYQQLHHEGETTNITADGDNLYIDCGEDWELYVYENGLKKWKHLWSAEEIVNRTPLRTSDGGVVVGSKKTTVFLVDAETGNVVQRIRSDNSPLPGDQVAGETSVLSRNDVEEWLPSSPMKELEAVAKPLYISRTDYFLKYTSVKTGKVFWYVRRADFEASFHCEKIVNFFGVSPQTYLDIKSNMKLPIHCQTQPVVYRIHNRSSLEVLIASGKLQDSLPGGNVLSLPASDPKFMLEPMTDLLRFDPGYGKELAIPLPISDSEKIPIGSINSSGPPQISSHIVSENLVQTHLWPSVIYGFLVPIVLAFFVRHVVVRRWGKLYKSSEDLKLTNATPKKRKSRKSGVNKNSISIGKKQENISQNDGLENGEITNICLFPSISDNYGSFGDSRKIGNLIVFDKEIAKGSNGTVILEGICGSTSRPVAVKRLVRSHHDIALKEIQNLIASDKHPNIVQMYGVNYDRDFIYIALERCACSLHELISFYASQNQIFTGNPNHEFPIQITINLQMLWTDVTNKEFELWKVNGYPSEGLLKLMRDIVCGVAHLHKLGIVHRDLKPQNVLVIEDGSKISAMISDMGISKHLDGATSLNKHATGYGTSGWQAPEQLRQERQTRAADLFSLGCVLFFCITGGKHPFGESLERDVNIVSGQKDLFLIDNIPEATDLISRLLDSDPNLRPNAVEVWNHPLFWDSDTRINFLRDASDRVELEDRESASDLLDALEKRAKFALGGKWDEKLDSIFINDIGQYRRYKYDSLRDLLRVIRNKLSHYRALSKELQELLGPVPEGYENYFSSRFPKLLIEVYRVLLTHCAEEKGFHKYFRKAPL